MGCSVNNDLLELPLIFAEPRRATRPADLRDDVRSFRQFGTLTRCLTTTARTFSGEAVEVDTCVNEYWTAKQRQANALHEIFKLEDRIKEHGEPALLYDWRRLTTSDHFYYMCTKYFADGDVHKYFNPYDSPYDSYINFMNVLDNLRSRLPAAKKSA